MNRLNYLKISDFLRRFSDFQKSKEVETLQSLQNYRFSLSFVIINYNALRKTIEFHNGRDVLDFHNKKIQWRIQSKIIHQLNNYLASVFSFVEFARKNVDSLISDPVLNQIYCEAKDAQFIKSSNHSIVQDFRNYITHYSYFNIYAKCELNFINRTKIISLFIKKSELGNIKWKSLAKQWLYEQPEEIYLFSLIEQHYKAFIDFQHYAFLLIVKTHYGDVDRAKTMISAFIDEAKSLGLRLNPFFDDVQVRYLTYLLHKSMGMSL